MNRVDVIDATPIVVRLTQRLSRCIPQSGIQGVQARAALGDLAANAAILLGNNAIGPPLVNCFSLVQRAGATLSQFEQIRIAIEAEKPLELGGTMVQNSIIQLCLATEAQIIAAMTFTSSQDADALILSLQAPFADAEERSADEMDQATYFALIELQAAVVNHLVTTARPLPRRVPYQFASVLPSLIIAHRLYADASRADEIRAENKIIHPAFCPIMGIALSA
jgi:hypothetical protein